MITLQDYLKKYPQGKTLAEPPTVKVTCQTCNDLGFVRAELPADHPLFGRLFPCPDCMQRGVGQSDEYGLLPADRSLSWDDISSVDPSIDEAKAAVKALVARGYGWLYLWGGYGTAKTALLKVAVAECLRNQAAQAVYMRMADLMDDIRTAYDANKPQVELQTKLRWYSSLPLLAIDEFEKVYDTGFVEERRFQVLDSRYETATRQEYGITLMAANVPPEKLPGAIASRVKDERFGVVHITAKDRRPYGKDFER